MLLQSLRAYCLPPGGSGSICKYLEALVRSPGVSRRIACCFRTHLHFADVRLSTPNHGNELKTRNHWSMLCAVGAVIVLWYSPCRLSMLNTVNNHQQNVL